MKRNKTYKIHNQTILTVPVISLSIYSFCLCYRTIDSCYQSRYRLLSERVQIVCPLSLALHAVKI